MQLLPVVVGDWFRLTTSSWWDPRCNRWRVQIIGIRFRHIRLNDMTGSLLGHNVNEGDTCSGLKDSVVIKMRWGWTTYRCNSRQVMLEQKEHMVVHEVAWYCSIALIIKQISLVAWQEAEKTMQLTCRRGDMSHSCITLFMSRGCSCRSVILKVSLSSM